MEDFLLLTILVVLFIRWVILSNRFSELKLRIDNIVEDRQRKVEIDRLVERVQALESEIAELSHSGTTSSKPPAADALAAASIPVVKAPLTPAVLPPLPVAPPSIPEPVVHHEEIIVESPPVPPPAFSIPEPAGPTFGQRMREKMSSEEWEAIVGGSWLNKLGVFVLVVGIALFLGYSFTQVGPAGVSAIALTVSLAMLAGGVVVERRARYVIFGRGLLGGGWAALYFTTYGMQALDAAKVIHSEVLGGVLLFAVAAGMIVHSLRYRSQTVTGLAYFVAFVTLAITQVTTLSVIALVPLAASLLFVAQQFAWSEMALFGLIATYGTCASRGDSGAPLWSAQAVFSIYWLLFEAFDLLRTVRRSATLPERSILPLNAVGFAALTYMKWSATAPQHLYAIAAAVAAAYLASAVVRCYLRPPSSFCARNWNVGSHIWRRLRRTGLAGRGSIGRGGAVEIPRRAGEYRSACRS